MCIRLSKYVHVCAGPQSVRPEPAGNKLQILISLYWNKNLVAPQTWLKQGIFTQALQRWAEVSAMGGEKLRGNLRNLKE